MAKSKMSMKLLIDTRGKRVLFAEAGKDCVDFLFHLLSLPVATIIRLLSAEGMGGSLPNLYNSLRDLDVDYMQPNKRKSIYLKPVAPVSSSFEPLLTLEATSSNKRCYGSAFGVSPPVVAKDGGIVKGLVTYMVMDDLVVKPMSTISGLALLNQFDVKNVNVLKEKVVNLGMKEALKLLKASLQSKNVLTNVFC